MDVTTAKLYVPKEASNYDSVIQTVKRWMAEDYGGYSAYGAAGGWLYDGEIIEEPVTVLEIVTASTADGGKLYTDMCGYAEYIKDQTEETEVLAYVGPSADSDGEKIIID